MKSITHFPHHDLSHFCFQWPIKKNMEKILTVKSNWCAGWFDSYFFLIGIEVTKVRRNWRLELIVHCTYDIGPVFKDYERDLKYMDLIMEDFNEDDEVWSNPVTDTLKITDSEQVVRGNFITCIRDINNTMSLLICDKIWVTFSLTICVKLLQVFLAWLFISSSIIYLLNIHILFLMKVFFSWGSMHLLYNTLPFYLYKTVITYM